jgi:hypothetical protein
MDELEPIRRKKYEIRMQKKLLDSDLADAIGSRAFL